MPCVTSLRAAPSAGSSSQSDGGGTGSINHHGMDANEEVQSLFWTITKMRRLRALIGRYCAIERTSPYFRTTSLIRTP
jgi:hypothetical protein